MSRLSEQRIVDPVLTELALGYANNIYVANAVLPEIEVSKEGFKIPIFTKESFKIRNTVRNVNQASNRIDTETPRTEDIILEEHDLEAPMDYREEHDADFELEKRNAFVVTEGILLRMEKMAADIVCDMSNYAADSTLILSGADTFDNASSNPIDIIESAKDAVRKHIARRPNTMLISAYMYSKLKENQILLDKIKYTETGVVEPAHMAKIFGVENVVIGEAVYEDEGVAKDVWGKSIVLCYTSKAKSMYEPTFGYTFKLKGMPQIDTYVELGGKRKLVRYTTIQKPALMGVDAGFLITE